MNAEIKKVLYVEDNLVNVLLVETIFESICQVQLVTASNGRSGLELAGQHRPDLILLDLHLPDMNGEDYLRQIRADPECASIPVVIVSGDADIDDTERFQHLGVIDFIAKPFDVDAFKTIVNRYLGQS